MTDDTRHPQDDAPQGDGPEEQQAGNGESKPEEKPAKASLSDEEKAAKIAAAKAKKEAAAAKKADQEAAPKEPWEVKPVPPEHADASEDPDARALTDGVDGAVLSADRFAGEVTLTVPVERIVEVCRFLKETGKFAYLVDLTAVDWPEREEGRFDLVYWMHRFDDSKRLRLRCVVAEGAPVASVTSVWKVADWLEREVYDMFGVTFEGHPRLERILTWEGFNGHPLRKDFPVEGVDTGAAIYPDVYPPGGGPVADEEEGEAS